MGHEFFVAGYPALSRGGGLYLENIGNISTREYPFTGGNIADPDCTWAHTCRSQRGAADPRFITATVRRLSKIAIARELQPPPETEDGDADAASVSSAIPIESRRLAPVNCRACSSVLRRTRVPPRVFLYRALADKRAIK